MEFGYTTRAKRAVGVRTLALQVPRLKKMQKVDVKLQKHPLGLGEQAK